MSRFADAASHIRALAGTRGGGRVRRAPAALRELQAAFASIDEDERDVLARRLLDRLDTDLLDDLGFDQGELTAGLSSGKLDIATVGRQLFSQVRTLDSSHVVAIADVLDGLDELDELDAPTETAPVPPSPFAGVAHDTDSREAGGTQTQVSAAAAGVAAAPSRSTGWRSGQGQVSTPEVVPVPVRSYDRPNDGDAAGPAGDNTRPPVDRETADLWGAGWDTARTDVDAPALPAVAAGLDPGFVQLPPLRQLQLVRAEAHRLIVDASDELLELLAVLPAGWVRRRATLTLLEGGWDPDRASLLDLFDRRSDRRWVTAARRSG